MSEFSTTMWMEIAPLYRAILAHPFNRELGQGSLSRERFQFYVIQDARYLEVYARVLAIAAAKSPNVEALQLFVGSAQEAIAVERSLHSGFLTEFGLYAADLTSAQPAPACAAYRDFLLATAYQASYPELLAALLPCFWIYWAVGNEIARVSPPDNPYQRWIDTYSDESFGRAVEAVIALTNSAAATSGGPTREAMRSAFVQSSRYEWLFWDAAYRQEEWPRFE
jgi:thiaminase (transcriptional activator TenA)